MGKQDRNILGEIVYEIFIEENRITVVVAKVQQVTIVGKNKILCDTGERRNVPPEDLITNREEALSLVKEWLEKQT